MQARFHTGCFNALSADIYTFENLYLSEEGGAGDSTQTSADGVGDSLLESLNQRRCSRLFSLNLKGNRHTQQALTTSVV